MSSFHEKCMDLAVELAGRCVPEDATPRPKVAAILTAGDAILATAYRGELAAGEHAEFTLLKRKFTGPIPPNARLYVTLEPCSGRSPGKTPCSDHVVNSGIKHVTIGALDPNPQIYGRGQQRLMEAGIMVDFFAAAHAAQINSINRSFNAQFSGVTAQSLRLTSPDTPYIILLGGPSSSGKDTILGRIRGRLIDLGVRSSFTNKFTTRPERPGESATASQQWNDPSSEYSFVSDEEFKKNNDITAKYEKYGYHYGFSLTHIQSKLQKDKIQFAIYGDISSLKDVTSYIETTTDRKCLVYLVRSDFHELEARLRRRRGFDNKTFAVRLEELRADNALIERLIKNRGNFKYFTNANDDNPDTVAEMVLYDMLHQMDMLVRAE